MMEERSGEQELDGGVAGTGVPDAALHLDQARWDAIVATLPPLVRARAVNGVRTRAFLEAVLWIAVTRQPWGRLPRACGPWHSVYVRFTRWAQDGIWEEVIASLQSHADIAEPLRRLVSDYLLSRHPASVARRAGPRFSPF
jgi:transposase